MLSAQEDKLALESFQEYQFLWEKILQIGKLIIVNKMIC
jgi:hypothetical protein